MLACFRLTMLYELFRLYCVIISKWDLDLFEKKKKIVDISTQILCSVG